MSRSNKSRNGMKCKYWKDTLLESHSQKDAWAKTKQIRSQRERTAGKAEVRDEVARDTISD